jgi:hypothetical protein
VRDEVPAQGVATYDQPVRESDADLEALQATLDQSSLRSGDHLRAAFDQDNRLSAQQLVDALPGIFELHLAVLSGNGAPLVERAPMSGPAAMRVLVGVGWSRLGRTRWG